MEFAGLLDVLAFASLLFVQNPYWLLPLILHIILPLIHALDVFSQRINKMVYPTVPCTLWCALHSGILRYSRWWKYNDCNTLEVKRVENNIQHHHINRHTFFFSFCLFLVVINFHMGFLALNQDYNITFDKIFKFQFQLFIERWFFMSTLFFQCNSPDYQGTDRCKKNFTEWRDFFDKMLALISEH